jgi:putative acetyltransferase
MYVCADQRGQGLAGRLLATAEAHAVQAGGRRMELWSDSRFARAHRFYEKHGYRRGGATRDLHDLSHTVEYDFHKTL